MQHSFLPVMGYRVYISPVDDIMEGADKTMVINTLNPHSYYLAKSDSLFSGALHEADILVPDGAGIVLAARVLRGKLIKKIAGSDVHVHLLRELDKSGGKVFYLGASEITLQKIKERLSLEYPHIEMDSYSPPYKPAFSETESEAMIAAINRFCPNVLFVGMTAPKQEKWVYSYKSLLNADVICSIGAVFDFYAGTVERPHPVFIRLGLEWLGRLIKEPKRMWRRNFISTPLFLFDLALYRLGLKKQPY